MWASLFTIAVAAGVSLSAVNLASEINKIQAARHLAVIEHGPPPAATPLETDTSGSSTRKAVLDPGV
jgi:hypothetical protein